MEKNLKIAIDCRMLGMSGVGVYLKSFLDYTLIHYVDTNFLLLGTSELELYINLDNVTIKEIEIPPFSIKEYFFFPIKEINECDIYFSPNYNVPSGIKIPICCTIHDLLFWDVKEISSLIGRWIRILVVKRAYHLSDLIFTVSKFSLLRINKHLGNKCTVVTYNALRSVIKPVKTSVSNKKYMVFVGNVKPHKGLSTLLQAYIEFSLHDDYDLVIVGSYRNFKTAYPEILAYEKENGISFTGKVSDDMLLDLIGNAAMLVQPSVYEGFGIPPMEALYLGVPVVLSDIPVFKEIYSDFPVTYFQCQNPESLASAVRQVKPFTDALIESVQNKISSIYNPANVSNTIMQALINTCNESFANR